jgi:hypothetical protein
MADLGHEIRSPRAGRKRQGRRNSGTCNAPPKSKRTFIHLCLPVGKTGSFWFTSNKETVALDFIKVKNNLNFEIKLPAILCVEVFLGNL